MTLRDVLFYVLYLLPFVMLWLYRDQRGCHVFKLTCANLLVFFYMICDHLGLILLYHNEDGLKQLSRVNPDAVIVLAAYSVVVVLAYMTTGSFVGRKSTQVRVPDMIALRATRINWIPMLLVLAVAAPLAIWKALDNSPMLVLLFGDAAAATAARVEEVTTDTHFLGIKPSYLNIIFSVLSVVQILSLAAWLARRGALEGLCFIAATLVLFLQGFSGVSKGAIIGPLYVIWFTYSLVLAEGRIVNKVLGWAAIYVITIVTVFASWVAGMELVNLWYPFERLILGNLLPQYVVVEHFGLDNLLWGTTTPAWFSFNSHKQFLLDIFTWQQIMGWSEGQPFCAAPSSFVAEAHANLHVFGVVMMSFLVFFLLRELDALLMRVRSSLLYAALMVVSAIHFAKMSVSGAVAYFVDYYYWAVVLFALIFYRLSFSLAPPRKNPPNTMVPA